MMKKLLLGALVLLAALTVTHTDALATGWSQNFVMNKDTEGKPWDEAVLVIHAITFANPGISNISDAAWSPGVMNAAQTVITIVGPARLSDLYFTLNFNAPSSTPFSFDAFQYLGDTLLTGDTTHAVWDGSQWTFAGAPDLPSPMPEPATLLLLGAGVSGLAGQSWWRKRRAR
jgi:hypothetical protein